jgi:hypothetical protein
MPSTYLDYCPKVSVCATDKISGDATSEEPRCWAMFLDVEASGEGELEDGDEGAGAASKDAVVDVDGEDAQEAGPSDGVEGGVDKGLDKAEGGEPRSEEGIPSTRSFADTVRRGPCGPWRCGSEG